MTPDSVSTPPKFIQMVSARDVVYAMDTEGRVFRYCDTPLHECWEQVPGDDDRRIGEGDLLNAAIRGE